MSLFSFRRPREIQPPPEPAPTEADTPEAVPALPEPQEREPAPALPAPQVATPQVLELPLAAYTRSDEHLWDELGRIDQLVRAQTVRWRATIAAHKPEKYWGMAHVSDAEVKAYLAAPYSPPHHLPVELEQDLANYRAAAANIAANIQTRLDRTGPEVMLRLVRLQTLFVLSELERDILLVALLPELDTRYRRLFGYLQDDVQRTRPSVELVLEILRPAAPDLAHGRAAFDAAAPLLAHRLLVIGPEAAGDASLSMRAIRVDDRIVRYLLVGSQADDRPDDKLAGVVKWSQDALQWKALTVDKQRCQSLQQLAEWWQQRRSAGKGATLFLHGPYGAGRLAAARAMCTASATSLLIASVPDGLLNPSGWEQTVALCYREAELAGSAIYWAGCEALLEPDHPAHRWASLVSAAEGFHGLTFMASQAAWDPAGTFRNHPILRVEFPTPGYRIRRLLWLRQLWKVRNLMDMTPNPAAHRAALATALANGFRLTEGQILDALTTARGQAALRDPLDTRLTAEDIYEGCRRQSSRRLMTFARRIVPRTELKPEHLILPAPNKRQLLELQARIRHRSQVYTSLGFERRLSLGKGTIALFTGASGTGKTMAAELLAHEHGVDLYKVDLSAVVSKYVGETEKNLSRVFAEAEDSSAILFFDEADALFGKRGEVREAQDRWANMEVNYLLQRVEEYEGVVILASNLRQNIDEAFLRRIHVIVDLPFPDAEARLCILRGLFTPQAGRPSEEELKELATTFKLSGGSFKNIVLDAAFRAQEANPNAPAITLRHLVAATAREYQKTGKPILEGEFGKRFYGWVAADILLGGAPSR